VSHAADTWLGVDSTWGDPANWSGGQQPSASVGTLEQATFPTYSASLAQPTVTLNETFGTLSFSSGSWNIGGTGTLSLGQISSTGSNTISPNLAFTSGSSIADGGGTLTLNGSITSNGFVTLSGSSSTVIFNGNNSNWTGGLDLTGTAPIIAAGSTTALGTGAIIIPSSGTTTFSNTAGSLVSAGGLYLPTGTSTLSISGASGFAFGSMAFSSSSSFGTLSITGNSTNFSVTGTTTIPESLLLESSTTNFIMGAVTGNSSQAGTLDLAGSMTGNTITGPISNGSGTTSLVSVEETSATSTWTLTGANTYTGATEIEDGTLVVSDATVYGPGNATITNSGLGSGSITVSTGALLALRANGQSNSTSQILAYANTGIFDLSTGTTTISVDRQGGTGTGKTIELGELYFGTTSSGTISVTAGDSYNLAFASLGFSSSSSFGTLSIAGNSTNFSITGTTTIPETLLLESSTTNFTLGAVTGNGSEAGTLELAGTMAGNSVTGPISNGTGTSSLISVEETSSTSTWTLTGANTYTGATEIEDGTLVVSDATAYGPGNATITNSGLGSGTITVSSGALLALRANGQSDSTSQILAYANPGIFELSTGTTTISVDRQGGTGTGKTIELGELYFGTTSSGTISVTSGDGYNLAFASLGFSSSSSFGTLSIAGNSTNFSITGTTTIPETLLLQSSTTNFTLGAVTGNGSNAGTLNLAGTMTGNTVTGPISNGTGTTSLVSVEETSPTTTWTLTGANTYTGGTNIEEGTLVISDATAYGPGNATITNSGLGSGTITVSSGAQLALRANGQSDSTSQVLAYADPGIFELTSSGTTSISVDRQGGTGTGKTIQLGELYFG